MKDVFKEVRVDKVSHKIADQLEELIKEGRLAPGDKLPGERELIEMLGVGRSSLREALNRLETLGYVEIRKRKGIFVKSMDSTLQLDPLKKVVQEDLNKIVQLYEIRDEMEQANARAAAMERTDRDLEELRNCLEAFETREGEMHYSWELDQAFHCAVARATHNLFRIHVIMNIFEFTKEFTRPIVEGFADTPEGAAIIANQHRSIYRAIEAKDPDAARQRMREHFEWANQRLATHFR